LRARPRAGPLAFAKARLTFVPNRFLNAVSIREDEAARGASLSNRHTKMLTDYAHTAGAAATSALERDEQKRLGQFMTPAPIARFMAARAVAQLTGDTIRILEPAAGAGVLAAAAVEAILAKSERPRVIELLLCEIDRR